MYIFHLRLLDKGPKPHNTLLLAIPHKFPAEAWPKVEFIIQIRARDLKFHLQISNQDLLYHDLHKTYSIRNDGDKYLKIAFLAQMPYVNTEYKTEEKDRFEVSSGRRMSAETLAGDGRILNQYVRLKLYLLSTYEHFNKLFCSRKVIRALASARGSVATRRVATRPRARRARGQRAQPLEGPKGPRVAKTCESEGPKGPRTS